MIASFQTILLCLILLLHCNQSVAESKQTPINNTQGHFIRAKAVKATEKAGAATLSDLIQLALDRNQDLKAAQARIAASEMTLREAKGAFFPTLSLFAEYMQGDAPSAFLFKSIDQRSLSQGTDFNYPGWFENYEAGIKGRLNLFNGGKDLYGKQMAETRLLLRFIERSEMENSLVASVVEAYYSSLAAMKYKEVASESIATVEKELANTKVRYQAGGALKSDVLSLEVRMAQAREESIKADNSFKMAISALRNLTGIHQDEELMVDDSCPLPENIPQQFAEGMAYAKENRPEVKRMSREVALAEAALSAARAAFFPRLDLEARYYHDSPYADFDSKRENWTIGMVMNWDLFMGGQRVAAIERARYALEEAKALEGKVLSSLELDIKNAYLRLSDASQRLDTARAGLGHAEESLRLVEIQYRGGSATITRYLEAELDNNRAKLRAVTAFYDREKALSNAARAVGFWAAFLGGIKGYGEIKQ